MADLKNFAEKLVNLTVKEVNELTNILKSEYGIEPAQTAVAVAPTGGNGSGGGGDAGADAAPTTVNVMLNSPGGSKLAVVKIVKELTGLGLKEAKEIVDSAPKAIKEGIARDEAEGIVKKLQEAGAEVELK